MSESLQIAHFLLVASYIKCFLPSGALEGRKLFKAYCAQNSTSGMLFTTVSAVLHLCPALTSIVLLFRGEFFPTTVVKKW